MARPRSSSTSDPILGAGHAGQLIAGFGATLALLGPFADWIAGTGVFILILGVVVAAPIAGRPGPVLNAWWTAVALAALACLIGFGIGFVIGWLGGLILAGGAVVALVTLALATPAGS